MVTSGSGTSRLVSITPNCLLPASVGPLTMGGWVNRTSGFAYWSYGNSTISQGITCDSVAGTGAFRCQNNAVGTIITLTTTPTNGAWNYLILTVNAAGNNATFSALYSNLGLLESGSAATSTTSLVDRLFLGNRADASGNQFAGLQAEFWYGFLDIGGGGIPDPDLVRKLAYNGPFCDPGIANQVVEYHSFRSVITGVTGEKITEDYYRSTRAVWAGPTPPTLGPHPPLPRWYPTPHQVKRPLLMV